MRLLRMMALMLIAVLVAACGVGPESDPRPLPVGDEEAVVADPAAPNGRAGALVELWFIQDDQLVPVNRTSEATLSDEQKVEALEAGPTTSEAAQGLRTALRPVIPDEPLVVTAAASGLAIPVEPDQIAVVLNPGFTQVPSQEQLLILGQVVGTLSQSPASSVVFVDEQGSPVGVPLPNGRLTSEPVRAADYAPLMTG